MATQPRRPGRPDPPDPQAPPEAVLPPETPPPAEAQEAEAQEAEAQEAEAQEAEAQEAVVAGLQDRWRRALADLDNLRKRYARELAREREVERAAVAAAWLPVVDDLERALGHAGGDGGALVDGLRSVVDEAVGVLGALGYPRQDQTGVPFDPARHEAVAVVEDVGAPPGTVVRVLRPGYGEGGRQLRPATVAVAGRRG